MFFVNAVVHCVVQQYSNSKEVKENRLKQDKLLETVGEESLEVGFFSAGG